MWILFSLLCMILLTSADIVGKKAIASDDFAPLKLRISVMAFSGVIGLLIYALGLGDSTFAPWVLVFKHPLILAAAVFIIASEYLYLFSLRYIGMSVMEALSGLEGITIFSGLLLINFITGKLSAVKEMLIPARLILIGIILAFTVLLPNIEIIANKKSAVETKLLKKRRKAIIGIGIAFLAVILGSCDSLINDSLLSTGSIGAVDYIMTGYFMLLLPLPAFCFVLFKKSKKQNKPFKLASRHSVLYAAFYTAHFFVGLYATSLDAVRTEILYLAYPVISIHGAKLILKEKYTWKQNLCIWVITLSAIGFCIIDYIV